VAVGFLVRRRLAEPRRGRGLPAEASPMPGRPVVRLFEGLGDGACEAVQPSYNATSDGLRPVFRAARRQTAEREIPMDEGRQELRRIYWSEALPFVRLFGTVGRAIDLHHLSLALACVVLAYIGGTACGTGRVAA